MLRAGDTVMVQNLNSRQEINGTLGQLLGFKADRGRWAVKLRDESILIKPANLRLSRHIACQRLPETKQTGFVKRFQEAVRLTSDAAEAARSFPSYLFYRKSADAPALAASNSESPLDVEDLVHTAGFLHACSAFVQAMCLTDARMEVSSGSGKSWSVGGFELPRPPDIIFHITDDPPPEDRSATQLSSVGPHTFVILLTAAWGAYFGGLFNLALRTANELERHLEVFAAGAPNEAALEAEPSLFCGLTVGKLRAALGCIGIKLSKQLYRMDEADRVPDGAPFKRRLERNEGAMSTPRLLQHAERYARLHMQGQPESPVGAFALAWASRQRRDGLVDATKWAREAVRLADAAQEDVVRATARIDLAAFLIGGGEQRVLRDGRPVIVPGATGELVEWWTVFELASQAEAIEKDLQAWSMGDCMVESYGRKGVAEYRDRVMECNDGRGLEVGHFAEAFPDHIGMGEKDRGN